MQAAAAIWMASIIAPWVIGRFGQRAGRLTAWIVLILAALALFVPDVLPGRPKAAPGD